MFQRCATTGTVTGAPQVTTLTILGPAVLTSSQVPVPAGSVPVGWDQAPVAAFQDQLTSESDQRVRGEPPTMFHPAPAWTVTGPWTVSVKLWLAFGVTPLDRKSTRLNSSH